jgi:CCR4-NOT transcriptional regulation complex NOT5 subunit
MRISDIEDDIKHYGTWSSDGMFIEYDDNYYNEDDKKVKGYIGWHNSDHGVMYSAETIEEVLAELISL